MRVPGRNGRSACSLLVVLGALAVLGIVGVLGACSSQEFPPGTGGDGTGVGGFIGTNRGDGGAIGPTLGRGGSAGTRVLDAAVDVRDAGTGVRDAGSSTLADASSCELTIHTLVGPRPSDAGGDADSGDPCVLMSTEAPPYPAYVRVRADEVVIPQSATNGWQYGSNTQTVVLSGSYCDDLLAGSVTSYTIIFGCGGVPIP